MGSHVMAHLLTTDDESSFYDTDSSDGSPNTPLDKPPVPNWNTFLDISTGVKSASDSQSTWQKTSEKILLLVSYTISFVMILGASITAKGATFFMLSQVSNERESLQFCNSEHVTNVMAEVVFSCPQNNSQASEYICGEDDCQCHLAAERAIWLWCIFLAFAFPNIGAFLRSLRIWLFKLQKIPTLKSFLFVTMMEVLHTVGIVLMVTLVLPNVDTLKGMTLSCGVYIIPSILLIF